MTGHIAGSGTAADPWLLTTPPGKSEFEAWRDSGADPPALVVQVGRSRPRRARWKPGGGRRATRLAAGMA